MADTDVTANGTTYTSGVTTETKLGMSNGGHRDNLIPMLADVMTEVGDDLTTIDTLLESVRAPGAISLTSNAIGTGAKSWTLSDAASMAAGTWVAYSAGSPSNFMVCTLATDLDASTALTMTSRIAVGSGTFTDWVFAPLNDTRRAVNIQTSAYTLLISDFRALIMLNKATADTLTIPALSSVGTMYEVEIANKGAGLWSIAPNAADAIDDEAVGVAIELDQNQSIHLAAASANSWLIVSARGYGADVEAAALILAL